MSWGIIVVVAVFVVVGYIVLQGTRASLAWRRAAAGGDVEVIRQMLDETMASWRSMKRPQEVPPDVWRGVQSVELIDVAADSARVSCQAEGEYRLVEGRWLQVASPLQEGMAVTARLAEMLLYDVANLRLDAARIDVYNTLRDAEGESERVCILSTNARREVAGGVDWEESSAAEIVEALGGRYRLGERGAPLAIDPDEGIEKPEADGLKAQAER